MTTFAQDERHALSDLLLEVGPDAPTLCEGWRTRDLAAHLVLRERRPDAAAGILLPPLAGRTAQVQGRLAAGPWPSLVETVRSGPPRPLQPLDEAVNTVEYFVHHEDVRRAADGWEPREIGPAMEAALWRRLRTMARLLFRRAGVTVELEATGQGRARAGSGPDTVRVTGPASELVLLGFGRGSHARVAMDGTPAAVERLRQAPLGV